MTSSHGDRAKWATSVHKHYKRFPVSGVIPVWCKCPIGTDHIDAKPTDPKTTA